MDPELLLAVLAAFAAFLLKTGLAFGLCAVFDWLVDSPNRRFVIWLSFLYGAAAYWVWLAKGLLVLTTGRFSATSATSSYRAVQTQVSTIGAWQIPDSWAFPLGIALRVIAVVYLLMLGYMLLAHIRKQRQLQWVLRFTTEPPADIAEGFRALAQSLHVERARLLVLSGVTSPATFGWIRPTILLPDVCLQQDRSELEDILRHELHHVRRRDFVWNALAMLCRSLIFFHPAAWYAIRKLHLDRELACDLAVVSHSPQRSATYAESLVRFARLNLQSSNTWGMDFAASSEHLKSRVRSILTASKIAPKWQICLRTACGLALLAGFIGIAPSLAVLLSYAHQQIAQPSTPDIQPSQTAIETSPRTGPRARAKGGVASTSARMNINAATPAEQAQPAPNASTDPHLEHSAQALGAAGPQLLRRSSSASGSPAPKQQTVALVDQGGSAQAGKIGEEKAAQALQQSLETAGSIYKRVSGVDRH
jgi:beta-lactamase regulating signal transducer with metallopeptidase domain